MSKSLGNFFTTREITALYDPEAVRYFLLTVHYRSGLNFEVEVKCPSWGALLDKDGQESGRCDACGTETPTEDLRKQVRFPGLEEADDRLAYIYKTLSEARRFLAVARKPGGEEPVAGAVAGMLEAFVGHMRNDFNTGGALGTLSKPLGEVNGLLDSGKGVSKAVRYLTIERFVADMVQVAEILGCFGQDPDRWLANRRDGKAARLGLDIARVEDLLVKRTSARRDKDWEAAGSLQEES